MKIVTWSEEILTGYHWNCQDWVKESLQAGVASAFCMLEEEYAEVAAWIVFYMEEQRAEIIGCGQETAYADRRPLERLFVRLWQFCREHQLSMAEAEQIGNPATDVTEAMKNSGMVPQDTEKSFYRLVWSDDCKELQEDAYRFAQISSLSSLERDSLIDFLVEQSIQLEDFHGNLLSELTLAALKDGKAEACMFASYYRGSILIESFVNQNPIAGRALWQKVQQEMILSGREEIPCYVEKHEYKPEFMKTEESVPEVRYLWVDQNLDLLSVEEEEAETGIRADAADDLGPVLLGRLYPVMDLLKSEHLEYQMALDEDLQPCLLVTVNSLGLEHLMKIRCIADDVTTGWFRFSVRTEFPGYPDVQKAAVLCSRLNREITDATIYWDEQEMLVLQTFVTEETLKKAESWRQLCNHWTNACRIIALRQLSDI